MNTLERKGLICYECKCDKTREEFSQTEDIYQCTDPEDLWCDQCFNEHQQQFIEQHDADFDEWCLTVV